ncbi:protein XRI1-like isoform X1 [Solanum pennellii]|uniref:Protein XRI1-like isoform X1 n=1 Tax=Solanum pennellii TaxID=28526 RepID=A0ABM1GXY4_SOLPN|nr:protein XRI1-like isoform X1 [Solanum pennellii]
MADLSMDFDTNSSEIWDWQCGETFLQDSENFGLQSQTDVSGCPWTGVTEKNKDISYMFVDETTPVKDCGDLTCDVKDVTSKQLEQCREPSKPVKRRRVLQFDAEILDSTGSNEKLALTFLKSKERNAYFEEARSDVSDWFSEYADGATSSAQEGFDESSEEWLTDCINDPELQIISEDMNASGVSDIQADTMEVVNSPPECEITMVKSSPARTYGNIVFKGSRSSYTKTPKKGASSVVYPFGFIKPCSAQGDVTLKEINNKIRTPPPSKSKQHNQDPPPYPTSAFSGKPVIGKTKIHTEGGRGSITIMRTKG